MPPILCCIKELVRQVDRVASHPIHPLPPGSAPEKKSFHHVELSGCNKEAATLHTVTVIIIYVHVIETLKRYGKESFHHVELSGLVGVTRRQLPYTQWQ